MITDQIIEQYADSYMSSREISDLLGIDRNTIQRWSAKGKVRMRPVEKRERHKPFHLYHVGDCIAVRLKRPKPKPFKHRRVNDVIEYCCNTCNEWKQRDGFYDDKRNEQHGILSQCKACHNRLARERSFNPKNRAASNRRARARMHKRAADAKAATAWSENPTIPARLVVEAIDRVRPNNTDPEISVEAQMHPDTIRNARRKANRGGSMFLNTVDTIFTNLNERDEFISITAYLDEIRPRWHEKYDYCQLCLRTKIPYMAKGMCTTCYRNYKKPGYKPMVESAWSLKYVHCVNCHCTDSRHAAKGYCGRCYQHHQRSST